MPRDGTPAKCKVFQGYGVRSGGDSMTRSSSRYESGKWELPNSSWAIPALTLFLVFQLRRTVITTRLNCLTESSSC